MRLWDPSSGQELLTLRPFEVPASLHTAVTSQDGRRPGREFLATGLVRVIDLPSPEPVPGLDVRELVSVLLDELLSTGGRAGSLEKASQGWHPRLESRPCFWPKVRARKRLLLAIRGALQPPASFPANEDVSADLAERQVRSWPDAVLRGETR